MVPDYRSIERQTRAAASRHFLPQLMKEASRGVYPAVVPLVAGRWLARVGIAWIDQGNGTRGNEMNRSPAME